MAYTGKNLYDDLKIRVYQGGAGAFLNTNRANYIIWTAIKELLEQDYNSIVKQSSTDEINKAVKVDKLYPVNNGKVLLKPLVITNVVYQAVNTLRITFDRPHNFQDNTSFNLTFLQINDPLSYANVLNNTTRSCLYQSTFPMANNVVFATVAGANASTNYAGFGYAVSDSLWLHDYYHLLATALVGRVKVDTAIVSVDISKDRITLKTNNIRTGEEISVSASGTNLNGSIKYYAKKIGNNVLELYSDQGLTTKVNITGTFTSGGLIQRYLECYAEPSPSDMKISPYEATNYFPLYQTSDNELLLQPSDWTGLYAKVDYISTLAEVDVTNNTTDLLQAFNYNFIGKVIENAAAKFFAITSSPQDIQISNAINQPR